MTIRGMEYYRIQCDEPAGCKKVINLAAESTEHMRETLRANNWWMAEMGDIVRDEITGNDFIGYGTYCPEHKERWQK